MNKPICLLIFQLIYSVVLSQNDIEGTYYVQTYTTKEYKAHKQTWSSVQDTRGVMYFANSAGILEYDGNSWRLIQIDNQNIAVRYLFKSKSGRIYVGSSANFGYLMPDKTGRMQYVSLTDKIEDDECKLFSGVNSIFEIKNKIYFAGDNVLFEYDRHTVKPYTIKDLRQTRSVNDRIFMRLSRKGLYELKNNKLELLPDGEKYKNIGFISVLPYDDKVIIVSFKNGLLLYDGYKIKEFQTDVNDFLKNSGIISAQLIDNKIIALGTFSKGLILINKKGELIQHLNTESGLKDNLISSIYEDKDKNLWLTGRNISYVLKSLPLTIFNEKNGLNHVTHSSMIYDDKLYIGNATGLYYMDCKKQKTKLNENTTFKQLGKSFTVWNIDTVNGSMLLATNLGIRELENNKLKIVGNIEVVWKFLRLNNYPDLLIACTNEGLMLLEFKENKYIKPNTAQRGNWHFKHKIKGFSGKSRHVVIDKFNNIWISNINNLVKKLTLNEKMNSVVVSNYGEQQGIKGKDKNYVFNIDGNVLVATSNGIFKYNKKNDDFEEDKHLNKLIGKNTKVMSMFKDSLGNIYYKHLLYSEQRNENIYELGKLVKLKDTTYLNYKTPFYKLRNSIYSLNSLPENKLLIGALKGFVLFKQNKKKYSADYNTIIRSVELLANDSVIFAGTHLNREGIPCNTQASDDVPIIEYKYNNIMFTFSALSFDNSQNNMYKFFLEGNDKSWSEWKNQNYREYSNLSEGKYVFRVKAKNIYEQTGKEAVFRFTIRPPWYRTVLALLIYLISVMFLIIGIVRLSVNRLRKQKEQLEQIIKERTTEISLKNEELKTKNETIESKNKNITSSIRYAKRIQDAMLPLQERIAPAFDEYFILFKPRDIVSGDFYWFAEKDGKIIFTAVDCTGHGVPGAFMSMIGSEILTTIISKGITKPSQILETKNRYVKKALNQEKTENHDGMDMSLCTIDKANKTVEWAGAKNPLIYLQNNELTYLKGDPRGIGGCTVISNNPNESFTNHLISYANADTYFYIFSDGYKDQFGGEKDRKFMMKRLKELIFENHKKPMNEQHKIFDDVIEEWKINTEQTDDILLIGFKLSP